ncbi:NAD(P)-binding domain-containing protein [Simiduia curdlanivorans]|uniref:Flavin-containing monooxygenase n=1 Tax=Simiduia curdlanivorans TaxID=1492769 RepID=A0ABV8V784_9GAMM|nr:NAD(P)-binding domain-containing protein [Simiduia curdlanivorans]MDN3639102.1 NAD(P)-binding domain-containing protein [Simiduia curdlanivorans]
MQSQQHYAIIGAGPMGLCTARQLKQYGIAFTGFELHSDVGGLWDIDNPHSTMYHTAHLISSKHMTEFSAFPMRAGVATFPRHDELCAYFKDYAKAFDLYGHYEFSTKVIHCEPNDQGWAITTEKNGVQQTRQFKGLLIANGTLHKPNTVALPGKFDGELIHSSHYKSPEQFKGKRVLIQGCGNSACDIAIDAVHFAKNIDMSVRRGYYFLPKFIMGKPSDTLGGAIKLPRRLKQIIDAFLIRMIMGKPSQYGLPDPDYRMYESHPVINSLILHHLGHGDIYPRKDIVRVEGKTVTFADGESREYDMILQATGYQLDYPFIARDELNWQGMAPSLYLNVFHPEHKNLFMMGMVEATGLGWQGRDEQAEMVALYIAQQQHGSNSAKALAQTVQEKAGQRADGGYAYLELERMAYYVDKTTYRNAVIAHTNALKADWPEHQLPKQDAHASLAGQH